MTTERLDVRAGASLILRELRRHWLHLGTALLFALVWTGARLALPVLAGETIDRAIRSERLGLLLALSLAFVLVALVQGLAAATRRYFAMRTSHRVEADLRTALYNRINRLSFDYYDRTSTGQLMSRGSTDLHEVQQFVMIIPINAAYLLMATGAFIILLRAHVLLAVLAMAAYPLVTLITIRFFNRLFPATADVQQGLGNLTNVVEENIAGARLVRAFGREEHEEEKLQRVADRIFDDSMEVARLRTLYTPLFYLLPAMGQLVILAFGGWLVLEGQVSTGQFVTFFYFLNMLIWPVQGLGEIVAGGQRAFTSAARVWNVLKEEPAVRQKPHSQSLPPGDGGIAFENVRFSYEEGHPVLKDVSFRVPAGTAVALVGPTGCGKSTVGRLLPRFYDVDSGDVLIDGVDIREMKLQELRRNVGLVFEDTFLFSDTIRNNIAYGRLDASDEEIEEAAQLAQIAGFIEQMPEGYDTVVGEQGYSLSGGQRQRIAIARALLMQPRVLILDDATSSVDAAMEEEIRNALRQVMTGRTTIIISHRLSTISLADQVVVLEDGRILDTGTHAELMLGCARYREILGQVAVAS
jgi:ATP-binding cassette subfamily B protein